MKLESYGLAAAPPDIRALFDRQASPEGCWDWFEILADTTLSGEESACIVALLEDDGRPVSAVPLVAVDGRPIRGLTSPFTTLFCAPLGSNENARALGQLVADKVGGTIRLDALDPADSAVRSFQDGLAKGGLVVARFRHFANWFEPIHSFADYWNGRESQLKSTVKRKMAALQRDGRLVFEMIDLAADGRRGTEIYEAIYARSWKPAEPHPHFIGALLEKMGRRGTARLGVAMIDGVPAAAQIWLVRQDRATIFKLAHDPAFDRQSPGTLLTHWMLRLLHEQGEARQVDFGRGDDGYKRLWLRFCQDREGVLAANPRTLKGLLAVAVDILPSRAAKFLRKKTGGSAGGRQTGIGTS
ncbi:MAG TPA: GNAT family N-acetyltransferase [Rhizomicrobium sp.]|nr:GNAT family N-acetyltransferase [Rhizomicrobium sp.]